MHVKKLFLGSVIFLLLFGGQLFGQTSPVLPLYSANHNVGEDVRSALLINTEEKSALKENAAVTVIAIDELLHETNGLAEKKTHKKFSRLLKRLHLANMLQQAEQDHSLYLSLANLFSRVKLYSLAMKCYLKTVPVVPVQTTQLSYESIADSAALPVGQVSFTAADDSLYAAKSNWLEEHANQKKQKAVNAQDIIKAFNDNKDAVAYALLLQVEQPVPGKSKVFKGINAGHTFITLLKYNRDSSTVCRSFGFYPQKDNILSGTPLHPTTASVFKNDEGHNWDVLLGRFVSRAQFKRVLKLIGRFEATEYKLSKNNCADFALQAANIAQIYISDTKAKWPLGYGNNPGKIGQSILQGKININAAANALYTFSTAQLVQ